VSIPKSDLYTVIMLMSRYSNMPELLDFFDYDCGKTLDFIHRFGGMALEIPTPFTMSKMVRDTHIFTNLQSANSRGEYNMVIRLLAEEYQMEPGSIRKIYDTTLAKFKEEKSK